MDFCVEGITKTFGGTAVLKNVDVTATRGEVIAIIGPSGAGKSTLLRCINLLTVPETGSVSLNGQILTNVQGGIVTTGLPLNKIRELVGFVAQEWNLWPNRTVLENVADGLRVVRGLSRSTAEGIAEQFCTRVQLRDKLRSYPTELSGGQKQRVAIARALAMQPSVLMLDEVTSALDPDLVAGLLDVIASLKGADRILLVVTHHLSFAREVADKVMFLVDGSVLEKGQTRDILAEPRTPELKRFLQTIERSW